MIIDCISDLHGYYPALAGGDLLIIAGDLTARDTSVEYDQLFISKEEAQKIWPAKKSGMTPEECKALTELYISKGWQKDFEDESKICFSYKESDEFHWIGDYDKKTRIFGYYNGNQKVNLVSAKNK